MQQVEFFQKTHVEEDLGGGPQVPKQNVAGMTL